MSERLTVKQNGVYFYDVDDMNVGDKLGQLEDLLDKYCIESVEELDKQLDQSKKWLNACELLRGEEIPVFDKLRIFGDLSKRQIYEYNLEKDCYEKIKYVEKSGTIVCRRIENVKRRGEKSKI